MRKNNTLYAYQLVSRMVQYNAHVNVKFVSDLPNTVSNKNIFKICVYIEMSFADNFLKIFLTLIQHVFEIICVICVD